MIYQYSEENKVKAIKRNQTFMSMYYGIGALLLLRGVYYQWSDFELSSIFPYVIGIVALPIAWKYFDRKFKAKMSTTYEIEDGNIVIKVNDDLKHKISLESIRELKKIGSAYRIESTSAPAYILDGIEGQEELIGKINGAKI